MSSRVLIPVLCVGAVLFACGPRRHDDATAMQAGTAFAATNTQRAPVPRKNTSKNAAAKSATPVSGNLYIQSADGRIQLALYVMNTGKKTVELTFPSGQTHDFVILDSLGREMWRWADGRMFTQTLRNRLLKSGEAITIQETWRAAALAPGTYTARATLKSQNYPIVKQTRFVVHETAVASR